MKSVALSEEETMKTVAALLAAFGIFGAGSISVFAQQLTGSPSTTAFSGQSGANRTLSKPASANEMLAGVKLSLPESSMRAATLDARL